MKFYGFTKCYQSSVSPRHGRDISSLALAVSANIYAMKSLGVTDILSISARGSLREDYKPEFVIVDQFIDRTFSRKNF